jgi:hypothetical protein
MKLIKNLTILFLLSSRFLAAQMPLNFGSIGWKYFSNVVYTGPDDYNTGTSAGIVNWTSPLYNTVVPAGWDNSSSNILPLGYKVGSSSYATTVPFSATAQIPYGSDATQKPLATYYRKSIVVDIANGGHNLADYSSFNLKLKADDGAVVYFNGAEVYRVNLPSGVITNSTPVINPNINETNFWWPSSSTSHNIPNGSFPLHPTINTITITVEIHQGANSTTTLPAYTTSSSDSFFDIELTGVVGPLTAAITRGPYLQLPHPTGMQVRWRTNTALVGRVCYGTSSGSLTTCVNDLNTVPSNEHIVNLTGLLPFTTYFYSVQHTTGTLAETSVNHKFRTPVSGTDFYDIYKTTRIWVTGDASEEIGSTSKTPKQDEVLNGFKIYQAANPDTKNLDLWLLLGDNAYVNGSDSEYSTGFFNPYDDMNTAFTATNNNHIMKQTPILPCVGNHDYYHDGSSSSNDIPSTTQTTIRGINDFTSPYTTLGGPMNTFYVGASGRAISNFRINKNNAFYDNFSLPDGTNPTALSNKYSTSNSTSKKGYYSYNHNNIHFICLDSYGFYNNHLLYAGIPTWPALPEAADNPQMAWLMQDLASNTQKWTIMYWHHSPYTRGGGHFSDNLIADEFLLVGIREKLIKYLDDSGHKIDLVLNGHSHSYERSRLLKGHYETESTFSTSVHNNNLAANAHHNGKFTSSALECPYIKQSASSSNEGIVYVVTGSAGQIQPSSTTDVKGHLALNGASFSAPTALNRGTIEESLGGSFYIEVTDNRLDAKFINEAGVVADKFTIMKDVNPPSPTVYNIIPGMDPSSLPLMAAFHFGDLVNLSGPTISGTQSFGPGLFGYHTDVATPQIGPLYTIKDATGCLKQDIRFHFTPDCWPLGTGVTINNVIDSPVLEHIRSAGTITAKNTIMPNTKVIYEAVKSINLEYQPPAPSNQFFEVKKKTGANQYFIARPISSCP